MVNEGLIFGISPGPSARTKSPGRDAQGFPLIICYLELCPTVARRLEMTVQAEAYDISRILDVPVMSCVTGMGCVHGLCAEIEIEILTLH